ncbi:IS66 family insertion sequence element accessory protein TnpB, partial [Paraburkholderia sp. BR13439]
PSHSRGAQCGGPACIPGRRRGASGMRSPQFAIGMLNVVWLGDLVKILWASEDGIWLLAKRLERGRFIWPKADGGKVHLSSAQLSMLLEGIDWRQPRRTAALSML